MFFSILKYTFYSMYDAPKDFEADLRLMICNCEKYNGPDNQITKLGRKVEEFFNTKYFVL